MDDDNDDNNDDGVYHLLITYYVPGTILSNLYLHNHLMGFSLSLFTDEV